jgi:hypothetical protein
LIHRFPQWIADLFISFLMAVILAAVLTIFSAGTYLASFVAFAALGFLCIFSLVRTWRYFGSKKMLAAIMATAFFIRIIVAVLISVGLPLWGYKTPVNQAGFLYSDAYTRDQAAYQLAISPDSLFTAFTHPDAADQYGGMKFLSAAVYRWLSPHTDRPLLISLLAAFAMTIGLAFLYAALKKRWNKPIAHWGTWFLALFPDSIFLGGSQMREPFLIGLFCISLWAVLNWKEKPLQALWVSIASIILMCAFSLPAGAIIAALLALTFSLEWILAQKNRNYLTLGWIGLAILSIIVLLAGYRWLKPTFYYDSFTTAQQSGWIQSLIRTYGERWIFPFTTAYGLAQPVLPAAITDPSLPIWKTIAILQGIGWYFFLPFLFFSFFSALKGAKNESKWTVVLFALFFFIWTVISSARAGGDQWDNPRYRYMLLPLMSILFAWSLWQYRRTHTRWLWRWIAAVSIFVLIFLNVYLNRSIPMPLPLNLEQAALLITALSLIIFVGGWLHDRYDRARQSKSREK